MTLQHEFCCTIHELVNGERGAEEKQSKEGAPSLRSCRRPCSAGIERSIVLRGCQVSPLVAVLILSSYATRSETPS